MKEVGYKLKNSCPDCKSDMVLRNSKFGLFYGCINFSKCKATHGAHQKWEKQGEPLGIPADKETKQWRIKAHAGFDKLWKEHGYTRDEAYKLLQATMGMIKDEAHIGKFNIDQCKKLIEKISNKS